MTTTRAGTVLIWDAASGREIRVLRRDANRVMSAVFSPDGRRIVTTQDCTVRIWDASSGLEVRVLHGGDRCCWMRSATFSPDGARIVAISVQESTAPWVPRRDVVHIWDAATGQEIHLLREHTAPVTCATFSPDCTRLATASDDNTARVWDADSGHQTLVLRGHEQDVDCVTFSPDGRRVLTASADGTARFWDVATGREILVFRGHIRRLFSAAFSHDGKRIIATGDNRNTAFFFYVNLPMLEVRDLIAQVCTRQLRGTTVMTRDEMRLAGYPDTMSEIDIAAGLKGTN